MSKLVPLTQGYVSIVDDDSPVLQHKWCALVSRGDVKRIYAVRSVNGRLVYMHRDIMRPEQGMDVDHINNEGLDNRRENLRICSRKMNLANNRRKRGEVGLRGVTIDRSRSNAPYLSRLAGKNLGRYKTADEAARAYDAQARIVYGEYAKLNFP